MQQLVLALALMPPSTPSLEPADSKHPQADGSYFQRREFCFTLDGDIFVRYQVCSGEENLLKNIACSAMHTHLPHLASPATCLACLLMQSFKDGGELGAALKERVPAKIDIGPVYTVDPQRRAAYQGEKVAAIRTGTSSVIMVPALDTCSIMRLAAGSGFTPVERELVFDIDLTDYDDVRTCGKEGHICNKCWPLMAAAIKVK